MMTIHAAKGLEFPVVFLCGMEDGLFPSLRVREESDETQAMEEERRLAYVALTRAKDRLVLTCARTRRQWGEIRMNRPSRFIDDIPAGCLAVRERPRPQLQPSSIRPRRPRQMQAPDELDQRVYGDDLPVFDVDEEPDQGPGFATGSQVHHDAFGPGRVIEVRGDKLVIDFQSVGRKTVVAKWLR
jgi:DNA helicase II / ATP-dependent DNA helicase PcrA